MREEKKKEKISFIICVNDEMHFRECLLYLEQLIVPEGVDTEILEIRDADSMTLGYQEGMLSSDAKYKVYMHQDVRIINRNFIRDLLLLFEDKGIGMVGLVGTPVLPADCIMWHGNRVWDGNLQIHKENNGLLKTGNCSKVQAIDGYLMATQYDINWRTDLFDGWDFYDISQSFEFQRAGYEVVVPCCPNMWAVHEEAYSLSLWQYDKYRRIFMENYMK